MSLAIFPPTPSLNVENRKNVSFRRGGVINNQFIFTTLIPGLMRDCNLYLVDCLLFNICVSRVAIVIPSAAPLYLRLSAL